MYQPRSISLDVIPRSIPSHPGNPHKGKKRSDIPSRILPSDHLRLSLTIPNRRSILAANEKRSAAVEQDHLERVHLHLGPNQDLFHPQAKINYLAGNGDVLRSEPLLAHQYKIYSGEVISDVASDQRLAEDKVGGLWYDPQMARDRGVLGHANIHLLEDGGDSGDDANIRFAGSFVVDGTTWNIMSRERYEKAKSTLDPVVAVADDDNDLVMFVEGDRHPAAHETQAVGCGHDSLEYNMNNKTNPVRMPVQEDQPWWAAAATSSLMQDNGDDMYSDGYPNLLGSGKPTTKRGHSFMRRDDVPTGGGAATSNYINEIGNTWGCPDTQKVVYVGFVADCNYVSAHGGSKAAREQILTNMNSVTQVYRQTFNVSLGVIELNVVEEPCGSGQSGLEWNQACSPDITLNERLSLFSRWRGRAGTSEAGLYHLATACVTGSEIGVAWLGTICQTDTDEQPNGAVSGTGVSAPTGTISEWSLIAHEMGHNFGAIHDCTGGCSLSGSCCPLSTSQCDAGEVYLMNPSTSTRDPQTQFSPCSIGNVCSLISSNGLRTDCFADPGGKTVLSLQSCGSRCFFPFFLHMHNG